MSQQIVDFFESERESLLSALFVSEISVPPVMKSLQYRMMLPMYLNVSMMDYFDQDIFKITEHDGQSYDWEIFNKKISVKSMRSEFFSRQPKRGNTLTKCKPIQLKNTKESIVIKEGEFDYLLIILSMIEESKFGMYVLSFDKVIELLKSSCNHNDSCDDNGYDGKGQIKLYLPSKEDCLTSIEMDDDLLSKLQSNCNLDVSPMKRNLLWLKGISKIVRSQISMSKKGNVVSVGDLLDQSQLAVVAV